VTCSDDDVDQINCPQHTPLNTIVVVIHATAASDHGRRPRIKSRGIPLPLLYVRSPTSDISLVARSRRAQETEALMAHFEHKRTLFNMDNTIF